MFIFFNSFTFLEYLLTLISFTGILFLLGFGIDKLRKRKYLDATIAIALMILIILVGVLIMDKTIYKKTNKMCTTMFDFRHYENKFTGKCVEFSTGCGKAPMYWAYKESEKCVGLPTRMDEINALFE